MKTKGDITGIITPITTYKKKSWANKHINIDVEIGTTVEDWIKDVFFTKYLNMKSWGKDRLCMHHTDEEDVQYGYVIINNRKIPFIARYLSTSYTASKYRIFFLDEYLPSQFNPDTFDYEEAITDFVSRGIW